MHIVKRTVVWKGFILLFFFISSLIMVVVYKYVPVYYTPLMAIRKFEHRGDKTFALQHQWVPLDQISQTLPQAVVASEDNLFLTHHGFDMQQIRKARDEAKAGKRVRGASTISQQTAKNVFLWPGKSYFRKGLEVYFTFLIETIWGKSRIMEVYLNSIEMGKGIFGAQAVAKAHFRVDACRITAPQAALIAASLPNPLKFNSGNPSAYLLKRQQQILALMPKVGVVDMGCPPGQCKTVSGKKKAPEKKKTSAKKTNAEKR